MIRRYTTPVQELIVEGVDLTQSEVYVTFRQNAKVYTMAGEEVAMEFDGDNTTLSVHFTQLLTAGFQAGKRAEVQVNWMKDGERNATSIAELTITRNLLEEVIDDA